MSREVRLRFDPRSGKGAPGGPVRLDRFLAARFPRLARADFTRLIDAGGVLVDGRPARKGVLLRGGEEIRFEMPRARSEWRLAPDPDLPLLILHEDADVVGVEKPAGVPCLPLGPDERGTVANALVARFPEMAGVGAPLEAGLVHRLDNGTSGLLLAARNAVARERLRAAWGGPDVEKVYLAVVAGAVRAAGAVDAPIAHHPRSARRMILAEGRGAGDQASGALPARTEYEPLRTAAAGAGGGPVTLLRVRLREGRRHQARLHLASIGHPVLGDDVYGPARGAPAAAGPAAGSPLPPGRLALHSHRLGFPHPTTGRRVTLESPVPEDLAALLGSDRGS